MNKEKFAVFLERVEKGLQQWERNELLLDAFCRSNPTLVEFAILAGADVNIKISQKNDTVINWAIANNHTNINENEGKPILAALDES